MGASGWNCGTGPKVWDIARFATLTNSILKNLLDVPYLGNAWKLVMFGNQVARLRNLHQWLQEYSVCNSYTALKGINTASLYIDQTEDRRKTESQKK